MCTIVYKLGGSLLSHPDLFPRLRAVLEQRVLFASPRPGTGSIKPLIVVGGGPVADAVRDWHKIHRLADELAHELALQSMSFNARLVTRLLPGARMVASRAEGDAAWSDGKVAVLASAEFVDAEERTTRDLLPRSWHVTSDSIAANVARQWPAAALVMLKSVELPADCDLQSAAKQGLVDPDFPSFARRACSIGWVNLRGVNPRCGEPSIRHWYTPATE
jgi:5-(aminomethyl)-3-furanmethanol phosphate kinase